MALAARHDRATSGPIGVLADDLTGAGDTALQFWAPEAEVWVLPEVRESGRMPPGAHVLALNTESRHLLPALAARAAEAGVRALASAGCTRFYKKVDSTLRGNIAIESLRVLTLIGADLAVVAPAFPAAGRITVGGYQLVDSLPVNASPYARDPLAPVRHSHVPTLLAEDGEVSVASLELKAVMNGPEAVAGAIVKAVAKGARLLVADAARHEDLVAIARAIAMTPYRVLPVGSAGLARALQPHHLLAAPRAHELILGHRAPVLVVAGSLNPVTVAQVKALEGRARVVHVDVEGLLLTDGAVADRLTASVLQALIARQDVVLVTGQGAEAQAKGTQLGRDLMMSAHQTGERLAAALGQVVARLVAQAELAGLVLAGGETAMGVCRALGSPPMKVVGELLPAIPLCRAELEGGRSLAVATKSGGFGAPSALGDLVERLKREYTPDS